MKNWQASKSENTVVQAPYARVSGHQREYLHNHHPSYFEEQLIYQHLLHLVQIESPDQMIERFRALFIERGSYPEPEILGSLNKIISSKTAHEDFRFFLNRCCHILINRWYIQPQLHHYIIELINLFDLPSNMLVSGGSFRYREFNRLRELLKIFINSEQYLVLRRFTKLVNPTDQVYIRNNQQPLANLISRYPYLYDHYLISEDSTCEQKETVRNFQLQVQKKFEIDLSHYVTYKVRRIKFLRKASASEVNRILRPMKNPTLLNDADLYSTLKQFIGKSEGNYTYQERAQQFLKYHEEKSNFYDYKHDLYEYLTSSISIDGKYAQRQFNQKLFDHLQNTLPDADDQNISEFLLIRTCSQLLNFLVVNSPTSPQHSTFLNLIRSQGPLPTIGLLLKVVLICHKVKPYLEKRLAILFNHYEYATTDKIDWFVRTLEQFNIAISIHFGNIDLSFFKKYC